MNCRGDEGGGSIDILVVGLILIVCIGMFCIGYNTTFAQSTRGEGVKFSQG